MQHLTVSIHARARRATSQAIDGAVTVMFQSTPAHGGRHGLSIEYQYACEVSIHARARRATSAKFNPSNMPTKFQSTPAHGGRHAVLVEISAAVVFQSTPAHGGRLKRVREFPKPIVGFNPRPRTAGDAIRGTPSTGSPWFQSTPAHGGRPCKYARTTPSVMFQSTPAHGGRQN